MKVEDGLTPEQQAELARLEREARNVAVRLDHGLNPGMRTSSDSAHRTVGFALLIFAFGDAPQPATWISNADRGDMIRAVEEWLEKAKARA